uniref:Uncharacterized protein n=1 Tax=Spongospora subterranea TaxID=70186 RepID=A0A0H5RB55_9EUKA|eukprot:CRZ05699.1 hypothetical protein [Spongospora subterranea]
MRLALKKCIESVTKRQKEEMKAMIEKIKINSAELLEESESTDSENDNENEREAKLRRLLIIQKQQKVNRCQFCKAFDDDDVNADRLESMWKTCRQEVVNVYKLQVVHKVAVDKNGAERVFVYVSDLDNYLTQIIALEGLPSTAFGDIEEPILWLRIGGDGRSIHRHSNNVLIVIALMDPANPRRSHSQLFVHTLMLIDGVESHDLLMDAMSVIDPWNQKLIADGFMYDGRQYKVNTILTGDMKFIQLIKGLQGATSVYSCPLCLKPKLPKMPPKGPRPSGGFRCACDIVDGADECPHWNGSGVYRTQSHASELVNAGGDCWAHLGHHKMAPLKSVEWTMIILDTLHGLLRISDVIFGSLYEWVRRSCDPGDKNGLLEEKILWSYSVVYGSCQWWD